MRTPSQNFSASTSSARALPTCLRSLDRHSGQKPHSKTLSPPSSPIPRSAKLSTKLPSQPGNEPSTSQSLGLIPIWPALFRRMTRGPQGILPLRTPRQSGIQYRLADPRLLPFSTKPRGDRCRAGESSVPRQFRPRRGTRTGLPAKPTQPHQCKIEVKNPGPLLAATCRSLHRRIPIPSAPLWCAVRAREAFAPLSAPVCYNEWGEPVASRVRHLRPHSR